MTAGLVTYPRMTIDDMRTAAQQRADMVNSNFVSSTEWNSYLQGSYAMLYDLLVQKYGNEYFVADPPYTFATDGTNDKFALPDNFFKLQGVDLLINANQSNGWITLHPFNRTDRNRFLYPNVQVTFGIMSNLRYRLYGNKLWLIPTPSSGQTVRVLYVPRVPTLTPVITTPLSYYAVIVLGTLSAGMTLTINGTTFTYSTDFTNATTLKAKILAAFPTWLITISGSALYITDITGVQTPVAWSSNSAQIVLTPAAYWSIYADGVGGWLDYAIVDAARKALLKEESDVSALLGELAALQLRIEQAAENRDSNLPATVADSTRSGNSGGWGWGDLGEPF